MRISELSEQSGVPVATVKYYLREGLLQPGEALNARDSAYSDAHLSRLRLIRGLVHVLGASIMQVKQILTIIETPGQSPLEAMGKATAALPAIGESAEETNSPDPARAARVLDRLGYRIDLNLPAVRQLDTALELSESVGVPVDDEQIFAYGEAARSVAKADFARVPWGHEDEATTFAVLGTALYEPVLLALRRLAHYEQGLELQAGQIAISEATPTKGSS